MNIIYGITGSVATTLAPKLFEQLVAAGHNVKIVATTPALYFIPPNFTQEIFKDKDEWPINGYHKNDPVKHIEFRTWADLLLIAPLTANTLAKISTGIADNFLCCIALAWPLNKPMIFAPAMNTEMWNNPITQTHINKFRGYKSVSIVDPISKKLACGDTGVGAMADIKTITDLVLMTSIGIDSYFTRQSGDLT